MKVNLTDLRVNLIVSLVLLHTNKKDVNLTDSWRGHCVQWVTTKKKQEFQKRQHLNLKLDPKGRDGLDMLHS